MFSLFFLCGVPSTQWRFPSIPDYMPVKDTIHICIGDLSLNPDASILSYNKRGEEGLDFQIWKNYAKFLKYYFFNYRFRIFPFPAWSFNHTNAIQFLLFSKIT